MKVVDLRTAHSGGAQSRRTREDNSVSILERLLYQHGNAAKTSDRHRAGVASVETNGHGKPDMLPLDGSNEACTNCNILVSVTGDTLDHELMALACAVAEEKHAKVIHVMYGIEVPRSKSVDEEMPRERAKAGQVLDEARADAKMCHAKVDPEYFQSRSIGQSLVAAAAEHHCSLLIVGVPYNASTEGQCELTETVDYVLKNAPCRVWVVRGQPSESDAESSAQVDERQPAGTR
jgi:nucleotide-binding universal stress UspA family protein